MQHAELELEMEALIEESLSHVHLYDCVDHVELLLALEAMKQLPFSNSSR